jgi:hypothetical protein
MAERNYTNEENYKESDRFRVCKNSESYDCKKKEFMAIDRRVKFCTEKCGYTYHNKIKNDIKKGTLDGIEANLKILEVLTCKSKSIKINSEVLKDMGFDFKVYERDIVFGDKNLILILGDFSLQRDGEKILIYKK